MIEEDLYEEPETLLRTVGRSYAGTRYNMKDVKGKGKAPDQGEQD